MSHQPSPPSLQQLREILLMPGEMLPEHVIQQIVALGPDAIAPLQAILDDEALHDEDSPAQGWAPIRATRLLGELRAASAIPRLLELAAEGPDFIITNEAAHALERIGEAAIEPILEAANRTEDDFYRGLLSEVLAASPRKDDRIFELLLRVLDDTPDVGIGSLAKYGDKRAIPVLLRLLEAYEPDPEVSLFADQTLIELKAALEELEAKLTPSQSALLEQHYREMKRKRDLHRTLEAQAAARQGPVKREGAKVGRNDPCPCGSGKKFKKCCGR